MGRRPLQLTGLLGMALSAVVLTAAMLLLVSRRGSSASSVLERRVGRLCVRPSPPGPAQMDVLRQRGRRFQLRGFLRGGPWPHPLVHRGRALQPGAPAGCHRCGRFL